MAEREIIREDPDSPRAQPGEVYLHVAPTAGLGHLFVNTDRYGPADAVISTRNKVYGKWHDAATVSLSADDGSLDATIQALIEVRLRSEQGDDPSTWDVDAIRSRAEAFMTVLAGGAITSINTQGATP